MANKIMKFINETLGTVRGIYLENQPWLYAADVCKALEIRDVTKALSRLNDDEWRFKESNSTGYHDKVNGGSAKKLFLVNEPGMYRLVFTSRAEKAREFQNWVFREVLPTLRREGEYQMAWAQSRTEGKEIRLKLTDTVKKFCEYLENRGELDRPLGTWIVIFTKLVNKTFDLKNGRDNLNEEELDTINLCERMIARVLINGMDAGKTHHEIYMECKDKLAAWQELTK